MPRALLCWELGKNRGHMEPLAQVGNALEQQGYDVNYAVRNTHTAAKVLEPSRHRWCQAPVPIEQPTLIRHPRNFSELLRNTGFGQTHELAGRLHAWRQLFDQTQPDILIADHAPTALLAGHAHGIRCMTMGSGFLIPPDTSPWPAFRYWETRADNELAAADDALLTIINQACKQLRLNPLDDVQSIYRHATRALLTLPALDHYPNRQGADYLGILPPLHTHEPPHWPDVAGKRVFAYLHPLFKTLPDFLASLADSGANVLVYLSAAMPELENRFRTDKLTFCQKPVDMAKASQQADLVICNGGHATVSTALLAGTPLLLLPLYLESLLTAMRVEQLGAGLSAPQLKPEGMRNKLQRLLEDDTFGRAASDFAARNTSISPTGTLDRLLAQIRDIT